MAATSKAQVDMDAALDAAASSPSKKLFDRVFSPGTASRPTSTPSPTAPAPPLTVESFSETVQQLMQDLAALRTQSEKQRITILNLEAGAAEADIESSVGVTFHEGRRIPCSVPRDGAEEEPDVKRQPEPELEWGYDQDGRWIGGHQDPWWN